MSAIPPIEARMALTPEQLAEIQRLRALLQQPATDTQRKYQAYYNAEQAAKKKAQGGRMSKGATTVDEMRKAIAKASGSNPPMANKSLVGLQDFHTSLSDNIKQLAAEKQEMIESTPFKYDVGHHVFTDQSARLNLPPMKILRRVMVGNDPIREGGVGSKVVKDPDTGKAKRTPYEPGYHVYHNRGEEYGGEQEFRIPETAIKGRVKMADGGSVDLAMAKGGSVKDEPKNTVKAYKLFRVHKDHPGKLFPLFVDANTPVEMNKWVDAKEGDMKDGKVKSKIGALAYRPGWHAGDLPIATHIGEKSDPKLTAPDRRPANHAWAEVEMPHDVDWQSEATKRGTNAQGKLVPVKAHITDQIPKGGHYRYKTNPNMTGNWLIGGSMKVNKVLTDAEVSRINKNAGMSDLPRSEPFKKKTFGFAQGGSAEGCIAPDEWKAEEHVNYKAEGGTVKPFDYDNAAHVNTVANEVAKHKDFKDYDPSLIGEVLSTGSYKNIEDPRILGAIRRSGFSGYHTLEKTGKKLTPFVVKKADGGSVLPSLEQMKTALMKQAKPNFNDMRNIGANEAPGMSIKAFVPPTRTDQDQFPVGGISMGGDPLPMGGVDMSMGQQGNQLMPANLMAPQGGPPQGGMPPQGGVPGGQPPPPMGGSNILQMTPQGQAMAAMKPQGMAMGGSIATLGQLTGAINSPSVPQMAQGGLNPNPLPTVIKYDNSMEDPADNENMDNGSLNYSINNPQQMAKGGSPKMPSLDQMKKELDESDEPEEKAPSKRITIKAEGPGGVTGIVVPHHMLHGRSWVSKKTGKVVKVAGMADINKARAEVYGAENRDPLSIGQIGRIHKSTLEDHFAKPMKEQLAAEQAAMKKLRAAKHLGEKANTLDKSEKLDTVNHEEDEKGRNYIGFASKGVAGHALYSSGHGKNLKHHVINTCPGQTSGCGGGTDANGVVDTSKGTCFAPNAESQYVHAAVRRATHEQAKHDPAMTKDWILSHTGSMRHAAKLGDKSNKVLLFRPNVVDETDVSSRHVIRHLNKQRKIDDKPPIIANSYGKTNELHDPENGYYVTHSNVGPKVKKGESIAENIARDKSRVRSTIRAADAGGKDTVNEQGNKTPPKNSYMVTDVKRNSPLSKKMESSITHAKYWSTGREDHELTAAEKEEGPEGHFGGNGKPTSEDKAHYGHTTLGDKRYDYQRQHILHPRLVQVGKNKDGTPHMIPTDSRFKDEEFLPKNRYKTKNGKNAGAIVMTTPTESTSNIGHDTSFTHHVNDSHVEHAKNNNGEYEIDKPEDQRKAEGKEYSEPRPIVLRRAEGGSVGGSDDRGDDEFHAFPEQNGMAQRYMTMRHDPEEADEIGHLPFAAKSQVTAPKSGKVKFHNDMDTINLELSLNRKKAK